METPLLSTQRQVWVSSRARVTLFGKLSVIVSTSSYLPVYSGCDSVIPDLLSQSHLAVWSCDSVVIPPLRRSVPCQELKTILFKLRLISPRDWRIPQWYYWCDRRLYDLLQIFSSTTHHTTVPLLLCHFQNRKAKEWGMHWLWSLAQLRFFLSLLFCEDL